jgi:hypothetical protein
MLVEEAVEAHLLAALADLEAAAQADLLANKVATAQQIEEAAQAVVAPIMVMCLELQEVPVSLSCPYRLHIIQVQLQVL